MGVGASFPGGNRGPLIPPRTPRGSSPGSSSRPEDASPPPPTVPPASGPVLLYDGACGVCARSIQFILRHDHRDRSLRFASLQSDFGQRILAAAPELDGVDSVIWVEVDPGPRPEPLLPPRLAPGAPLPRLRTRIRSDAALTAATYLGGGWRWMARVGRLVPRRLRDAVYDLVARNRHRLARRSERCLLPTPDQRRRFLDGPDAEPGADAPTPQAPR